MNKVKGLRKQTGMTRKEFAEYFNIPYRTVEDWETDKSECKDYVVRMMAYMLAAEHKLNATTK